jgi:tetratricopeptide (TPR) repeat protein
VTNASDPPPGEVDRPKSILDRITGTTTKLVAFLVVLTALMTQIPNLRTASQSALCSLFSCTPAPPRPELKTDRERVDRQRLYAIQLLEEDNPKQAIVQLNDVEKDAEHFLTDSVEDKNLRGFIYKTYAQAYAMLNDKDQAKRYADLAIIKFQDVRDNPVASNQEKAIAIKGIGNIESVILHENTSALLSLNQAQKIYPSTPNIWNDIFVSYYEISKTEDIDLPAMAEALNNTKRLDEHSPGEVRGLESMYKEANDRQALRVK